MTRRHRRAHLLMWIVLGPLVLVVLAVAVSIRPVAVEAAGERASRGGER